MRWTCPRFTLPASVSMLRECPRFVYNAITVHSSRSIRHSTVSPHVTQRVSMQRKSSIVCRWLSCERRAWVVVSVPSMSVTRFWSTAICMPPINRSTTPVSHVSYLCVIYNHLCGAKWCRSSAKTPITSIYNYIKSMAECKKDVTPLLMHWSHVFHALTDRNAIVHLPIYDILVSWIFSRMCLAHKSNGQIGHLNKSVNCGVIRLLWCHKKLSHALCRISQSRTPSICLTCPGVRDPTVIP